MTINKGIDKSKAAEPKKLTHVERLKEKESILHEQLVEQTQALQLARAYRDECLTAVETTMRQLEDVRHNLYRLWQQSP